MERILLTTDFSETSSHVLDFVIALVEGIDARIDILHVYDSNVVVKQHLRSGNALSLQAYKDDIEESIMKSMDLIPQQQSGSCLARDATYPSAMISAVAEERNCTMICMGMRQKYAVSDRLLGTVTGRTMESSTKPVLAIPNGAVYNQWKNILLITNDQANSGEGEITLFFRDLMQKLGFSPSVHLLRMDLKVKKEEGFKKIHKVLQEEKFDLICVPADERELLADLYHSGVPRTILYQTRLPIFLL